eukprot:4909771-Amphidinium_carterae.1
MSLMTLLFCYWGLPTQGGALMQGCAHTLVVDDVDGIKMTKFGEQAVRSLASSHDEHVAAWLQGQCFGEGLGQGLQTAGKVDAS